MSHPGPSRVILATTDLTDGAREALRAARLLRPVGGRVHVAHCLRYSATANLREDAPDPDGGRGPSKREDSHETVGRQVKEVGLPLSEAEIHILEGAPHREIPSLAKHVDADLVTLGKHSPRRVFDGLLGSTADRVIRLTDRPCLVANKAVTGLPRRVVVASDLSRVSRRVLDVAVAWAEDWSSHPEGGAVHLELLHVFDFARPGYAPPEDQQRKLQREAARGAQQAGEAVTVRARTLSAPLAPEGIQRVTEEVVPDLLFMGTHGHGFFVRTLLGSVASEVVRTVEVPIVVVPPGPEYAEPHAV